MAGATSRTSRHGGERANPDGLRTPRRPVRYGRRLHTRPGHRRQRAYGDFLVNAQGEMWSPGSATPSRSLRWEAGSLDLRGAHGDLLQARSSLPGHGATPSYDRARQALDAADRVGKRTAGPRSAWRSTWSTIRPSASPRRGVARSNRRAHRGGAAPAVRDNSSPVLAKASLLRLAPRFGAVCFTADDARRLPLPMVSSDPRAQRDLTRGLHACSARRRHPDRQGGW